MYYEGYSCTVCTVQIWKPVPTNRISCSASQSVPSHCVGRSDQSGLWTFVMRKPVMFDTFKCSDTVHCNNIIWVWDLILFSLCWFITLLLLLSLLVFLPSYISYPLVKLRLHVHFRMCCAKHQLYLYATNPSSTCPVCPVLSNIMCQFNPKHGGKVYNSFIHP